MNIHDASVPVFTHFLRSLSAILKKAEAHCAARKIDPNVILAARLFPDMFAFTRQVQIASDTAKGAGARLAGVAVPSWPDEEKSFDDLQARIGKTLDFLTALKPDQFAGAEDRDIHLKAGGRELDFKGFAYLETSAKPNFFFHLTTAYAILRHNGIELGKPDFLAGGQ
ncbi:DUF1993 family protein [Aestuariivirga sp.]|uniref:DUF1993 domain-containing protein n=1 Tax=Aestuariivirga sp. TaxID=2650926 RepID=UPI0025C1758C|nr:DUF1993 domain-containing protein [Aestuariivirga sp.]MCA3556210.1 DUF1993 domain-containing protein [Aestuariivirga sp.]